MKWMPRCILLSDVAELAFSYSLAPESSRVWFGLCCYLHVQQTLTTTSTLTLFSLEPGSFAVICSLAPLEGLFACSAQPELLQTLLESAWKCLFFPLSRCKKMTSQTGKTKKLLGWKHSGCVKGSKTASVSEWTTVCSQWRRAEPLLATYYWERFSFCVPTRHY